MSEFWTLTPDDAVRVTDTYYDEALKIDVQNILKLDADRLLAGFRETAGLLSGLTDDEITAFMKGKKRYEGMWENGLIGGHTMGHYLTALAQAAANHALTDVQRADVQKRLEYVVNSLLECQEMTAYTDQEGYIFGASLPTKEFKANPVLQFDNVEEGKADLFKDSWVPWYTMHKILTGLNAAFKVAGNNTALKVANNLGYWISKRTRSWSEKTRQTVLSIEYGGMNDCLYELYVINRTLKESGSPLAIENPEILFEAAHSFDEDALFERVLSDEKNMFNNVHANTTIPKFIGALARFEADNTQTKYLEYAKAFWNMVIDKHTYVTGGNSENEHWGEDYILDSERTNVNNETCNTYNMLKFSRRLFAVTGDKKYLDYSERTLINAIMASQNHETGFTTYFQPMATGYHKVFNTFDGNFWCCTGTGYENFTKLQRGIYFLSENKIAITLYLASSYETDAFVLRQECDLSRSDDVMITIAPKSGKKITSDLYLRIPEWINGKAVISLNGSIISPDEKDGFLVIPKENIIDGGVLTLKLPMSLHYENLPDGKNTYAFLYGPYVLSARLGNKKISTTPHGVAVTVSATKCIESDELTVTSGESVADFLANINKHMIRKAGSMDFELTGISTPLTFTTHYNQYTESYGIYWKLK